jgi:hypothetical protein
MPLQRMQRVVRASLTKCFNSDTPDLQRIIGMPIRGSDKCYRDVVDKVSGEVVRHGEASCVTLTDTMELANRIHSAQPWVDTVLVTSEDKRTLESTSRLEGMRLGSVAGARWTVLTNSRDVQQGTGRSGEVDSRVAAVDGVSAADITESILTTLACQALPMHHIVLMRSNFGDLIDLLSKAVPGRMSGVTLNSGGPVFPV